LLLILLIALTPALATVIYNEASLRRTREAEARNLALTSGPSLRIKPTAALSLAMAVNELATNALKYGALSRPSGSVDFSWSLIGSPTEDQHLELRWIERGGPPVQEPVSRGFGSRLIHQAMTAELSAKVDVKWDEAGVDYKITAPVAFIAAEPG
jgi:two-component sensor histidine kinase